MGDINEFAREFLAQMRKKLPDLYKAIYLQIATLHDKREFERQWKEACLV